MVIEQYQTHGTIELIDENDMIKIKRTNLPTFTLPFNEESISKAKDGLYRERSTGLEIENPDFLTSWTVKQTKPEHIEKNKLYGFEGFLKD